MQIRIVKDERNINTHEWKPTVKLIVGGLLANKHKLAVNLDVKKLVSWEIFFPH